MAETQENNGPSTSQAEVNDGEEIVQLGDVIKQQDDMMEEVAAVLGAGDDFNCSYNQGYMHRQALYACLTCVPQGKDDFTKAAGFCLACSYHCHDGHNLIELYTKRRFRCDCGNLKFSDVQCNLHPNKDDFNTENTYNQNFSGLYCICHKPYPDPEVTIEDDMIQCIICEDWYHSRHLNTHVVDDFDEMICEACVKAHSFLLDYSGMAVTKIETSKVDKQINVVSTNECHENDIEKVGIAQQTLEKLENCEKLEDIAMIMDSIDKNDEKQDEKSANDVEMKKVEDKLAENVEGEENRDENEELCSKKEEICKKEEENDKKDEGNELVDQEEMGKGITEENEEKNDITNENKEETDLTNENKEESDIPNDDNDVAVENKDETNITYKNKEENEIIQEENQPEISQETPPEEKAQGKEEVHEEIEDNQSENIEKVAENNITTQENFEETNKEDKSMEIEDSPSNGNHQKMENLLLPQENGKSSPQPSIPSYETSKCTKPNPKESPQPRTLFMKEITWRQSLCKCDSCLTLYETHKLSYLLDPEDTVQFYEAKGKEKFQDAKKQAIEAEQQILKNMPRAPLLNAMAGFNDFKEQLAEYLKQFAEQKKVLTVDDVNVFFSKLNSNKRQKTSETTYFCR